MEVYRVIGFVEVDEKGCRVWEVRAKVVEGVDVVGCGLPLSEAGLAGGDDVDTLLAVVV